jgi:hypothetical protein
MYGISLDAQGRGSCYLLPTKVLKSGDATIIYGSGRYLYERWNRSRPSKLNSFPDAH